VTTPRCSECGHPLRAGNDSLTCCCWQRCPAYGQGVDDDTTDPSVEYVDQWLQIREALGQICKRQSVTADPVTTTRPTPAHTTHHVP
jgi:hypothetical protein